jgi:hypothetical protein
MSFLLQPLLPGAFPLPLSDDFDKNDFLHQCLEQGIEVTNTFFSDVADLTSEFSIKPEQQGLIQFVPKTPGLAVIFYSAQVFHRDQTTIEDLLVDIGTAVQCRPIPGLRHETPILAQVLIDESTGNTMQVCTTVVQHAHPDFYIRADGFTSDVDITDELLVRFATWVDGLEIQVDND